jgi:cell filamentation protein
MSRSDDAYLQPNGTLRNQLGITDQALLSLAEGDLVAARAKLIELNLPRPPFSFDTLKAIHHELFQDVYTWAGQARATPIGKREYDDPASLVQMFAAPDTIEARANALFRALAEQNFLTGTSRDGFAAGATAVFAELNRLLLSALAANAGHTLAFDVITRERMIAVSVAAHEGDPLGVQHMFDEILDPRQVAAMRKAIDFLRDSTVPWNDLYISTTRAGQDCEGILVGRAGEDFMLQV